MMETQSAIKTGSISEKRCGAEKNTTPNETDKRNELGKEMELYIKLHMANHRPG